LKKEGEKEPRLIFERNWRGLHPSLATSPTTLPSTFSLFTVAYDKKEKERERGDIVVVASVSKASNLMSKHQ